MAPEIFARLAIYLTQTSLALVICFALWNLSRIYQQAYISSWYLALLAFGSYQLAILVQRLASVGGFFFELLQFITIVASYTFAVFLLRGMLLTRANSFPKWVGWRSSQILLVLSVLGLASVLPFIFIDISGQWKQYFQVYIRLFLMGVVLLTAAVSLLQRLDSSLGQRLAAVSIFLWGILYLTFSIWRLLSAQEVSDIQVTLAFKSTELLLLCTLGLAMLIWLHEHERTTNVQLAQKTQYLNRYDQLTGALNRDALLSQLHERLQQQTSAKLYLLMLGLDKFKTINESVGLKQGDLLLRQLNQRFENSVLKPALVARTGGDIFALALADINSETQLQFAIRHIQQLVEKSFDSTVGRLQLTCTMGIACAPDDTSAAESLLQKANIAYHQAKRLQVKTLAYRAGMEDESARLISWETELLSAIQNDEFVLYFQPQFNLRDQTIEAFEVLVRWQHPEKGFLMPGQFLPYVEQLGLSRKLDFWVLTKAIQTMSVWKSHSLAIPLAVNMSPLHFQQDGLKRKIQHLLQTHKVSPDMLELEITENTAMHDVEKGSNHVFELQQMGIRVSIDDFGTGYSSLAYLRRMPIDKIKIDRSFVTDMAGNDSDMMIVKTMIKLAHGLGKRILAEGVETEVQLSLLKSMACDTVQGYYIAKPLAEEDALAFYREKMSL